MVRRIGWNMKQDKKSGADLLYQHERTELRNEEWDGMYWIIGR